MTMNFIDGIPIIVIFSMIGINFIFAYRKQRERYRTR